MGGPPDCTHPGCCNKQGEQVSIINQSNEAPEDFEFEDVHDYKEHIRPIIDRYAESAGVHTSPTYNQMMDELGLPHYGEPWPGQGNGQDDLEAFKANANRVLWSAADSAGLGSEFDAVMERAGLSRRPMR